MLTVSSAPLRPIDRLLKRLFDIAASLMALVLLTPLFIVVSLLIKMDSQGPVFFRQRRRGYNQKEFRIWKFRTMMTLEDGADVQQAKKNDPRITRIGAWLRKYNIDELPQLLNVLTGEMSLVGPRPHALAHDIYYETIIDQYGRRLNVMPGITGWAQVNGLRGQTETREIMQKRVEYDIYYVEKWSLPFDLYILLLTVISPKAYRNAY